MATFDSNILPYVPTGADANQQITAINRIIDSINAENNLKIIKDGTTNRVIIGKYLDTFAGIKISKPGVDVTTAKDSDLVFNSNQNVLKVVKIGTTMLTGPKVTTSNSQGTATTNTTIRHGLGYVPIVVAFVYDTVNAVYQPLPSASMGINSSTLNNWSYDSQDFIVDDTNLIFFYTLVAASTGATINQGNDITIKYYLLQETAN